MTDSHFHLDEDFAFQLDAEDPLARYRERFYHIPGVIYMDGNALGLMSMDAEETLRRVIEEWRTLGIGGWGGGKTPWITYAESLGAMEAGLVGAEPDEVVVCGGTTVNLHALAATFYRPEGKRRKILADELNFPSDLYALAAQIRLRGGDPDEDLYEILETASREHSVTVDRIVNMILKEFFENATPEAMTKVMKNAKEAV